MSDPIQIDVRTPDIITIDVSNKIVKVNANDITQALGYIPEDQANKVTEWQTTPTDINYPSEKLVKDTIDTMYNELLTEAWAAHVQETDTQDGDILIYSSGKFINRPKEDLTDGGNF